jgi:cobalt/nickel transport system permease protein
MSHLHLPDGVVPWWLWAPALGVVIVLLTLSGRGRSAQGVAYQGALGGLMLAAMAIPFGPLEYHLTLVGPVGVLLGAAGALPVIFVVSATLALIGHGGLTVVGLNTLVMGAVAVVASAAYGVLARRLSPAWALALASGLGHLIAGSLWLSVIVVTLRSGADPTATLVHAPARTELLAALTLTLWIAGTLIESVVAFGIGRFLSRVHPALLPDPRRSGATPEPQAEPA